MYRIFCDKNLQMKPIKRRGRTKRMNICKHIILVIMHLISKWYSTKTAIRLVLNKLRVWPNGKVNRLRVYVVTRSSKIIWNMFLISSHWRVGLSFLSEEFFLWDIYFIIKDYTKKNYSMSNSVARST